MAQRWLDRNRESQLFPASSYDPCVSMGFNAEWWDKVLAEPMLGYSIAMLITWGVVIGSRYSTQAADSYKDSWAADKIATTIRFASNKIEAALPSSTSFLDTMKFVALSGTISASYGLIGAACLGRINSIDDAVDLSTTQAVGGAALPAIGVGLFWAHKAAARVATTLRSEKDTQDVSHLVISIDNRYL